jgi:hypothetical protein
VREAEETRVVQGVKKRQFFMCTVKNACTGTGKFPVKQQ